MRKHGHSVLGGIAGLFFGLFLGIDLLLFGVVPFNSPVPFVLTVLGLVGGVLWGRWTPIGAGKARAAAGSAGAAPQPAPEPVPEPEPQSAPVSEE